MTDLWHRFGWWLIALAAVIFILILAAGFVKAQERTVACALWSRELTRIEVETASIYRPVFIDDEQFYEVEAAPTLRLATPEVILRRYREHMRVCEGMPDLLPSLPTVAAGKNEGWARSVATLATRLDGVEPAAAAPEGWEEACAAQYKTWEAATGTVIRAGNPERVRCPLVLVDGVWTLP